MENKTITNQFQYLDMDSLEEMANENSVSFALNGIKQNEIKVGYGYSNERGTELCATLPEGYKLRGFTILAERDEFILFLYNGSNSEIGAINPNTCTYKKYVNDEELPCRFNFGFHEWITIIPKRIQPCNEIELYWSNQRVYKHFNIDSPNRHLIESCDDINLMKLHYTPTAKLYTVKSGGLGILNGTYQVVVRLSDSDGNHTNWMHIGQPTKIYGGNNIGGEVSEQYIDIRLQGLTKHYKHIDVAIVKTINGQTSAHIIYNKHPYAKTKVSLRYYSISQEIMDISLSEIYNKSDYWIHGKGLIQKDNRLILFDIDNHWNLDYQRQADKIQVGWSGYRVRAEDASLYPSLMGSENYLFFIRWNYFDGTTSPQFVLSNHNKSQSGVSSDSCSNCEVPDWETKNTATVDWTAIGYNDPFVESQNSTKTYENYTPTTEPYKTVDEWAEDAKDKAEELISELKEDLKKSQGEAEDAFEAAEASSCCDANVAAETSDDSPVSGCENMVCPPTCVCINGCCYEMVPVPDEHPTGTPDPSNEDFSGCGGIATEIPNHVYIICTAKPLPTSGETTASVAYSGCNTNNGICPGCKNCHPESAPITTRSGYGSFETPPEAGMGKRGLCNGGVIGTGCGEPFDLTINNPNISSNVSNEGELEIRSNPCDINCDNGACPPGCTCEDPASNTCSGFGCETNADCGEWCDCIIVSVGNGDQEHLCLPNSKKPRCISIPTDSTGDGTTSGGGGDSNIDEDPIYDEDGCTIIGYRPILVAKGKFGYAESKETYPNTLQCDGKTTIYTNAGKPITLFKAPSRQLFPHFISYQTGVKSKIEPGNDELTKGYVQVIGINLSNIEPPLETPKPLDKNDPFTIGIAVRDDANKTILAKGYLMGTFEGEVYGETYMFPMNGAYSLEFFNRYIKSNSKSNNANSVRYEDHAGYVSDTAGYTFHSPDSSFKKSFIKGHKIRPELEVNGFGYRHGLFAYGNEPSDPQTVKLGGLKQLFSSGGNLNVPKEHQKKYRGSIHFNKLNHPLNSNGSWSEQCIHDITYVNADGITKKSKAFDRAFFNRDSEACVYMQVSDYFKLHHSIDKYLSDGLYNGDPEKNLTAINICDGSFLGDVKYQDTPIYNATSLYAGIHIRNLYQYGRLESMMVQNSGIEGTWDNYISKEISGICGDVYISPYSFTKTTYVSDRVGRRTLVNDPLTFEEASQSAQGAPEEGSGKHGKRTKGGIQALKKFISYATGSSISWAIGLCGNPPVSGLSINIDPRNKAGLRHFLGRNDKSTGAEDAEYGGYWDGVTQFPGYMETTDSFRRCYYPGIQSTEMITWVESEVAVPLRKTGEEVEKEIHYFNTKSYGLDSSFSGGIGWKDKLLNFGGMLLNSVTTYQKIFITLVILLVRVALPIYIVIQVFSYIKGGGGIVGTVAGLIVQIIAIVVVVVFCILLYITLLTFASEYLITFFGLKQCYNDFQGGPGDSLKKKVHDNYHEYNWDYSLENNLDPTYTMPHNYNTCKCVAEPSNKIVYSNPQLIDASYDTWRNFKVNNVLTLGTRFGKITHISTINNNLWAYTTDMIYNLRSGDITLDASNETVVLGRGDFINQAYPLWENVNEGYAGLKYPNGLISTELGDFYIDHESGRLYLFNGQLEEISTLGVSQFLKNNTKFKSNSLHIDQKCDDGIGYAWGYDRKFRRLLITKRDNEFSWTLSYSIEEKKWISFHSYVPHLYMWDRYGMFTEQDGKIWRFNTGDKYQTYFNKYYPYVIEFNSKLDAHTTFQHKFTSLNTEAIKHIKNPNISIRDLNVGFNKGIFMNTNQSTGIQNFKINDGTDLYDSMKESPTEMNITRQSGNWRYSDITDYTLNPELPIYFLNQMYQKIPNQENLTSDIKHLFQDSRFLTHQLILDNRDDIELIAKNAITLVGIPQK